MRLFEKANSCEFHDTSKDRILEHLIHTIPNKTLIQKCLTKGCTLSQFLAKACEYEDTYLQIRKMKGTRPDIYQKQHHIYRTHRWPMRSHCGLSGIHRTHRWPMGSYCGLSGIHPKGTTVLYLTSNATDAKSVTILQEFVMQHDL